MQELTYNTFLVTGGAGFIGSHICGELLNQQKQVICVDNLVAGKVVNIQEYMDNPNFRFVQTDCVDIDPDYFRNVDVVFHNAASKCTVCEHDPELDLNVNAWGTFSVIKAAYRAGVKKVIHA